MKDFWKVISVTLAGCGIVMGVYPLLHESGHALVALAFGGKIESLHVFPAAYVVCNASGVSGWGRVAIGLGGMLLPFVLSAAVQPKSFWGWYVCLVIRGISALSFLLSSAAMVLFYCGKEMPSEDIVQVLKLAPECGPLYFAGFAALFAWGMVRIVASHPLRQCMAFVGLEEPFCRRENRA